MSATHSILRRSVATADNPPFVPSPQWLSESPARPPSSAHGTPALARIDYLAQNTPRVQPQTVLSHPPPDPAYLRSPVPPPPANLFTAGSTGLNVDPGLPFLANASSVDAGSDKDSIGDDAPRQGKLAGSIVSGLKKAVGSLRRGTLSSRSHSTGVGAPIPQPATLRDSGYGHSTPQLVDPATFPVGAGADQYYPPTHNAPSNGHVQQYASSSPRSPVPQNAYTPAQIMSPTAAIFSRICRPRNMAPIMRRWTPQLRLHLMSRSTLISRVPKESHLKLPRCRGLRPNGQQSIIIPNGREDGTNRSTPRRCHGAPQTSHVRITRSPVALGLPKRRATPGLGRHGRSFSATVTRGRSRLLRSHHIEALKLTLEKNSASRPRYPQTRLCSRRASTIRVYMRRIRQRGV